MPTKPPTHKPNKAGKPQHNPRGNDATNRQRTRAMHTGSKGWKLLRARILRRDLYACRHCGGFGEEVDHINGNSHDNDPENLQTLCTPCHSRKTRREQDGKQHRQGTEPNSGIAGAPARGHGRPANGSVRARRFVPLIR